MKNVYFIRDTYFYGKMVDGKRRWVNLETKDEALAIQRAVQLINHPIVKSSWSSGDEIQRFIDYKVSMNHYSRNSAFNKKVVLEQFRRFLPENSTISNISFKHVQDFYDELRGPVTISTANGYLNVLSAFFRWCCEVEKTRRENPVKGIKLAKIDKPAKLEWCRKEVRDKLIKEAPNDELRFILFCGFHAGLRKGEIIESRKDWFDLKLGHLRVRKCDKPPRLRAGEESWKPKFGKERTVPLTREFKKFLRGYLQGLNEHDFALYADVKHGKHRYRYDFKRPLYEYTAKQKVHCPAHKMRHSFASILASSGKSIFKIAEWLGDRVDVTQRHYAHLCPSDPDIEA